MIRKLYPKYLLAILSGLLFSAAFYSVYLSPLAWICLIPLFISIYDEGPGDSFRFGLVFGMAASFAGQYWLIGTLTRFGGFPLLISLIFILIFCIYAGLQYALFTYICSKFKLISNKTLLTLIAAGCVWITLEYYFPKLFPYGIGNSQGMNTTFIQVSDIFGLHFLSFIIVLVNIALFRIYSGLRSGQHIPLSGIAAPVILVLFMISYGKYKIGIETSNIERAPKIKAGIVQANFDFFEKNEENSDKLTDKHKLMSHKLKGADLIIWPETAVQSWLPLDAEYYKQDGVSVVPDMDDTLFLIGGLSFKEKGGSGENRPEGEFTKYNSAFLLTSKGEVLGRYNKIELLMFGEYMPFSGIIPSIKKLSPATGDFTPGSKINLLESREKGLRIGTLICYEDIIPYYSRQFVRKGANLLVNLTNDAWFGKSVAPYQHLLVAIPRAVETRRSFIRSTNTGVSAFIDSAGRVIYRSDIFEDAAVKKEIALMDSEETIYVRLGEIFPLACMIFSIFFIYYIYLGKRYIR